MMPLGASLHTLCTTCSCVHEFFASLCSWFSKVFMWRLAQAFLFLFFGFSINKNTNTWSPSQPKSSEKSKKTNKTLQFFLFVFLSIRLLSVHSCASNGACGEGRRETGRLHEYIVSGNERRIFYLKIWVIVNVSVLRKRTSWSVEFSASFPVRCKHILSCF